MRKVRRWIILLGLIALAFLWLRSMGQPSVAQGSILVIDLAGEYVESAEPALLTRLFGESHRSFVGLLSEIEKAGRDDRLAAVVFRVRGLEVGWARAQELRDAIARLSARGRRCVSYLELGSFNANLDYYVASAAPAVYAAPANRAPLVGLAAQYLFLGGFWDLFGIDIEVERIGRYKTAVDTIAGSGMSDANREMSNSLLDSIDGQFVAGIAASRKITPEAVRTAIDDAPSDPDALLAHRLIDGMRFYDELLKELGDGKVVSDADYAGVSLASVGFDPKAHVALIYGSGAVVTGRGSTSRSGSPVLASDTLSEALDEAARDDAIDAIIFRVDSPGGSPLASDIVWRAAVRARERGKPLIVSMSDVAASGGYYVSVGADAIVASPASITGSIGVFVLRPVLGGLFEKLGIGSASLQRGAHADILNSAKPLSPESRARLRSEVASIYGLFVDRVAAGRGLDHASVDAVGQGRVWTGAQALEHGLVDELGGLHTATRRVAQKLGLDPDADIALVVYPQPKSLFEQIQEMLSPVHASLLPRAATGELRRLEPWLQAAAEGAPVVLLPFNLEVH
jgi:protease IV